MLLKAALSKIQSTSQLYIDDVFSAYTRTGTGAEQTITTNIDMTQGYMVWSKGRSGATDHAIYDSVRGVTKDLVSNSNAAETTQAQGLKSVSSTGHTWGTLSKVNTNNATYVDWIYRVAPKFFGQAQVVKSAGSDATVSFSNLETLGMVEVKNISTGDWYVWHRSLTAGKLVYLNKTDAEATLGHITVSGTTVTLEDGVIANGTYIVYAYAHDTSDTGLIQCGSTTTNGAGKSTITLGWETQFLMVKYTTSPWYIFDINRGFPVSISAPFLRANGSDTEGSLLFAEPTATGFNITSGAASTNIIYLAIRRSNKPPTSGTQVYNAIARTGTGTATTITNVEFAPDLVMFCERAITWSSQKRIIDKLRGNSQYILTQYSNGEESDTTQITSFGMNGVSLGTDTIEGCINKNGLNYINHFLKRASGFFDEICYIGTGSNKTETHNLKAAPELWVVKGRSGTTQWVWGSSLLANTEKIVMPSPNGKVTDATAWNSTYPTSSVISLGTAAAVNTNGATYVCYMWATLAGISKIFSYTGDGGSGKVINCGFSSGARFVMIIRTTASTAQDIFIWDTVRGIVAGNDPHLSLNSTAAEVTTDDSIDPDNSGFAVNQVAATNINVNGAVYIGLAIA